MTPVALLAAVALIAGAERLLPFEVKTEKLPNGLTLVMVPQPSPGLIAYYSLVRVGSRDEVEKGVTGFAHFFEHMMFRGTKTWTPDRVQSYLKKTGADQNGFTTDDYTCFTFFGRNNALEELVQMEADRFQNLDYTEDAFKTESRAVLGEYNKSASSPMLLLEESLRKKVFGRHTYGHTTLGYLDDIKDMPNQYAYSKKFFDRFYTPDGVIVIAVGDFDPAALSKLVTQYYTPWSKKRDKADIKDEPPQKREILEALEWKTPTLPIYSLSWRTPATQDGSRDTAVYELLYELLFGKISGVYNDLVLKQQLVDSFSEESWLHRDPYLFHVIARLKAPESFVPVGQRIDAAIAELVGGKLHPKLLEDVKAHVRYGVPLSLTTPDKIAGALASSIGPTGNLDALERRLKAISEVTVKDVQKLAQKVLVKTNRSVITLVASEPEGQEGAQP